MSDRYRDIDPDGGTRRRLYTIGSPARHKAGGLSLRSEAALRPGFLPLLFDCLPLVVA